MSEKEQWEHVRAWVRLNAPWLAGGVLLAALLWSGYNWWHERRETRLLNASVAYQQLIASFAKNDLAAAESKTDELLRLYAGTGYADQAELALARLQLENGHADQAMPRVLHVMNSSADPELKLVARLRVARLQIEQQRPDDALATLAAAEAGAFAPNFAEVRGDALFAKGDRAGALKAYQEAQSSGAATLDAELLKLKISELGRS